MQARVLIGWGIDWLGVRFEFASRAEIGIDPCVPSLALREVSRFSSDRMRPRRLANLFKLVDADNPVGKDGADVGVRDTAPLRSEWDGGHGIRRFGFRDWGLGAWELEIEVADSRFSI